ncbi:rhizobactin siderophore biosynthesis protein RhbF [Arthrobacter crystallopoietes BAB-32]|uniref:Rhizobactin siderophore biosynthesis protein RhbF n=1 Tax=Arthrobacter crystallopoietes BAB-32 TaxID=1246476 RepID=N1V2G5_9MICC|nr:IucA/IucC family siderophore biosynthesis protein [Arthrobacter crystallopoietes]EMY34252.1 rhizobactin siderophore biosynthesis protein RhbF [Arthrobacter crystallopoietes BAB-32]
MTITAPSLVPAAPAVAGAASHLEPARWAAADRHLVRKAIAEFAHERILRPEPSGGGAYRLASDDGRVHYHFAAERLWLDHWSIPSASIHRLVDGVEQRLDALDFITEFRRTLGISETMLPVYLEEIGSTLAGHAFKQSVPQPTAAELAAGSAGAAPASDFQRLEQAMTEGHPCFVANNGRLGFGLSDYLAYAPETGAPVQLVWLAVHADHAEFTAISGLGYREHLEAELGSHVVAGFDAVLAGQGLDPEDYLLMPAHPWQYENKLTVTFAAEIAQQRIVHLGPGPDAFQAQQSIRTFFNLDEPSRCYVKTALSVLNMGFMRGLSPEYMASTPPVSQWLHQLVGADPELRRQGFSVLRERAAVGYRNRYFEAAALPGAAHRKMLSALWRESPVPALEPGQRLATMASLLHTDADGAAFASALIRRSGLSAAAWLERYLQAYLVPVLHCFYRYELVGMPHGENIILVLEDGVPVRAILKDLGEEVVVMGDAVAVPPEAARIRVQVPEQDKVLSIFTDVFDCFFRFLAALLHEDGQLDQHDFWRTVAKVVAGYQDRHPELAGAFARHDLFAPEFALSCLNRLQLRNNQQMLDLADPSGSLLFSGTLSNPLAPFRPTGVRG